MTEKPPFDEFTRAWMELMQAPANPNQTEQEFAEVQQKAYAMVMEGLQAFATGFSERAVEQFRTAAATATPASADAARISELESRLALVEAELASLRKPTRSASASKRKSTAKPKK